VVKTQPVTPDPPPRPRIADLKQVNENITVAYPVRPSDAHQRLPLEPLFHIDTEAQPAAQPMSIDGASDLHSIEAQAQTHAVTANGHAAEQSSAAQSGGQHGPHEAAVKAEDTSSVKTEDLGQVRAAAHCVAWCMQYDAIWHESTVSSCFV